VGINTEERLVISTPKGQNTLFPVFFKLEKVTVLLVGGGYVATEKLTAIFQNSPQAKIRLVATEISKEVRHFINQHSFPFEERPFTASDLEGIDLAIIAINDKKISTEIYEACAQRRILTNVADKPDLCDFYLSSVVQKGNLKIAISTNGKSPTIAKRVKETLNDAFPDEIDNVLEHLATIRNQLSGDFSEKVKCLNDLTSVLVKKKKSNKLTIGILYLTGAIGLMILGHILFSNLL